MVHQTEKRYNKDQKPPFPVTRSNGGNISYRLRHLLLLAQHGFQGLVFDYEGYGRSEGSPSQEKVLYDAISAMNYIVNRADVKNTKLILFGQSLGAHLACVLGGKLPELYNGKTPIDAFVIEDGFSGHRDIAAFHETVFRRLAFPQSS